MNTERTPYPKIELHVHLEATIQPETLLAIAKRNGEALPTDTVEGLRELYRFRDFDHFIEIWILTTNCLRTEEDFRQVVVDYAAEAKRHGAVYLEAIFSPIERTWRGVSWGAILEGYSSGAQLARELHGVEVVLSADITRSAPLEDAHTLVREVAPYRDRGIVAVGLGGEEAYYANELFASAFQEARAAGLGSVPHAGEVVGPESVRSALDLLEPDRIRHGVRAIEDSGLVRELADRGLVLDMTPISNVRTGVVPSLKEHPLPKLVEAGVRCSVSTDDPVMFDTDLTREYEAAEQLGLDPRTLYEHALAGALCEDGTKTRLEAIAAAYDWESVAAEAR
jgi:aminodeoxyfutalosine deaminase